MKFKVGDRVRFKYKNYGPFEYGCIVIEVSLSTHLTSLGYRYKIKDLDNRNVSGGYVETWVAEHIIVDNKDHHRNRVLESIGI